MPLQWFDTLRRLNELNHACYTHFFDAHAPACPECRANATSVDDLNGSSIDDLNGSHRGAMLNAYQSLNFMQAGHLGTGDVRRRFADLVESGLLLRAFGADDWDEMPEHIRRAYQELIHHMNLS